MKKIYSILLFPVLFLSGCGLFITPQVREFDLNVKPDSITEPVRVAAVRNLSNSGQRFLLRSGAELSRDSYNLWTTEPGALIGNALNRIFSKNGKQTAVFICDVDCFEADLNKNVFRISGSYRRQGTSAAHCFDIATEIKNKSPESIVDAASKAVEELAVLLSGNKKR